MTPRRVLMMISSMRGGGSEQQILLLLRHLDRQAFAPELYVTERVGDLMSSIPGDVKVHSYEDAIRLGGIYFPGRLLRHQTQYLRDLICARNIDVIYDRTFHMTMIGGPAADAAGIPRVSTIVSPPDLALPSVEKRFVWLKRRRLAKAYRQSRAVIAVSKQAASSAESYYDLPTDSVRVIPNPVDIEQLESDAASESISRDERLTLVCVGRMTPEKGHHDLISALELAESSSGDDLPNLRLLMIGDGPLRRELEGRWKGKPHRHQIEFWGAKSNPAPVIAAADALVLPSHFEGMPNVVLEAMTLETPVIATRSGGTVELEGEQSTILWARPKDPPSLVEAIKDLANDRDAARCRAETAKAAIHTNHDARKTIRQIEDLLR